jgi:hypothetical protein
MLLESLQTTMLHPGLNSLYAPEARVAHFPVKKSYPFDQGSCIILICALDSLVEVVG